MRIAPRHRLSTLLLPLLALAVLAGLRFAHWNAPVIGDEAYTLRGYASKPLSHIATHYESGNNHVLLSMIVHLVDAASPKKLILTLSHIGVLRLPSILASIAALLLMFRIGSNLYGPRIGVIAAFTLGLSYWHLAYAHMLRAYSLSTFLNLAAVLLLQEGLLGRGRRGLLLLGVPAAVAALNYALASNAYYAAAFYVWAALIVWKGGLERRVRDGLIGALAAGAVLTAALYAPIITQVLEEAKDLTVGAGESVLGTFSRLEKAVSVLGYTWSFRVPFLLVASAGAWLMLRRDPSREDPGPLRGDRGAALLSLTYLLTPVVAATLHGTEPFIRAYVVGLPFWALLFARGADGLFEGLAARVRVPDRIASRPAHVVCALILALSAGELGRYLTWNRGMDLRRLMVDLVELSDNSESFAVIYAPTHIDVAPGRVCWDYYAVAANMPAQFIMSADKDFPYLLRTRYYVVATSPEEARTAMRRSGADPLLLERLRMLKTVGRLSIYEVSMSNRMLEEYRRIAADKSREPGLRAQALTAVAFANMRIYRMNKAVSLLEEAKGLSPLDPRVRYYLGKAHYLNFDDPKAEPELAWAVANDTANVHAPFYYADVLTGLGRFEEAKKWYEWYFRPEAPEGSWYFKAWAYLGVQSLLGGTAHVPLNARDYDGWAALAKGYHDKGSYERAIVGLRQMAMRRSHPAIYLKLADIYNAMQNFGMCAELLKMALEKGDSSEVRVKLVKALMKQNRYAEARREAERILREDPNHRDAVKLKRELDRL